MHEIRKGYTMKLGKYTIPQVRKFLVAFTGVAVLLLNSALEEFTAYLPDPTPHVITYVVGLLTALGVFLTKNAPIIDATSE